MKNLFSRRVLNLRTLSPFDRVRIVMRAPSVGKLAFALYRDPRVPVSSKAMAAGAIALILSPIDLPGWVPVVGQAADVFVIVNVLDVFITSAPRHVVQEHIEELGLQGKIKI